MPKFCSSDTKCAVEVILINIFLLVDREVGDSILRRFVQKNFRLSLFMLMASC